MPVKPLRRRSLPVLLALFAGLVGVLVWRGLQPGDIQRHLARLRAEGVPTTSAELDAWYPAVLDAEKATKRPRIGYHRKLQSDWLGKRLCPTAMTRQNCQTSLLQDSCDFGSDESRIPE